ncbi:MAG: sulfurtransferase [Paraglaciecola sp.]|nr:sulfurtransferase [Paraglaciecola sp.]NCT47189.1 sulfurtransferase [Paraglaciecola sp.]
MPNIIDVNWLKSRLGSKDLVILFTSMKDISTGQAEPIPTTLIPGSIYVDFEGQFCDHQSPLPHTLANEQQFEKAAQALGINADTHLIVYDAKGVYTAPRVWWMFNVMGHHKISILNGGLPAWLAAQGEVAPSLATPSQRGNFKATRQGQRIVDVSVLQHNMNNFNIIDARSAARFHGTAPEPRLGLRSGHIPGSVNLPFTQVLHGHYLKGHEALKAEFAALKLDASKDLVMTCGSGVTACILALAAEELGYQNCQVYDGSWSEWGGNNALPIVN